MKVAGTAKVAPNGTFDCAYSGCSIQCRETCLLSPSNTEVVEGDLVKYQSLSSIQPFVLKV